MNTPGPWKRDANWHVTGPDHDWKTYHPAGTDDAGPHNPGQIVCHVNGPSATAGADFHLITAAPELLATLKVFVQGGSTVNNALRAMAAIAKAEGKAGDA